tara:strand:- start:1 stop:135 length:135 start_codon:yes stop_codon:yes gene_type:complete
MLWRSSLEILFGAYRKFQLFLEILPDQKTSQALKPIDGLKHYVL